MSFPAYPAYKKSGSDRLGDVPAHWEVVPCRAIVDECVEKNNLLKAADYLSLMANIGIIRYEDKGDIGNKKPDDLSKCKIVKKGDLVINSMNYGIGSYGLSPLDGICSPVYIVLDPRDDVIQERFALRIFEGKEFQAFAQSFGNGILAHRSAIGWGDLKNILVALPPIPEQTLLSNFLDHETARIDALIDEQQRLIELLKEKRQAVISRAVTKGLDPTVPMKDSGVDWLGEVPAHWQVTKLSFITSRIGSGKTPNGGADTYVADGVKFIRSQNVYDEGLRLDDCVFIDEATDVEMAWSRVKPLDVLINITGASIGRTCIVPEYFGRANVNQHVCVIRLSSPEKNAEWVSEALKATPTKHQVDFSQTGAAREGLNFEQLARFWICIPPLGEMSPILAHIRQMRTVIEQLLNEAEKSVYLLQERRSALISAAVTGKIDVRGWQPPASASLPETVLEAV